MVEPERETRIRRVAVLGLGTNVALAAFKLAAGLFGGSRAVVADALHSISDCASDIALLVGPSLWSRPSDSDHQYGHARIETVITVAIGLLLAASGVGIAAEALATLHIRGGERPALIALLAAATSVFVKEALYHWSLHVGKKVRSPAVMANAWHHRSDAFSSVPAVLAVGGAILLPSWGFLDRVGAVVVSIIILQAAVKIVRPALGQLIDTGLPEGERRAILETVARCPGVERPHDLRTRYLGPGVAADLHVEVRPDLTVAEGHEIAEDVRKRILDHFPDVVDVIVHVDPMETQDRRTANEQEQSPPAR